MEHKKYKLTTIKDIFDHIPTDKIQVALAELGQQMVQAKGIHDMLSAAIEAVSSEKPVKFFEWPDSVTWIDDDKGETTTRFIMADTKETICCIKTTSKP